MGRRKVTSEIVVDPIVTEEIEETKIEELTVGEEPDPFLEDFLDNGQLYGVYDNGNLIAAVYDKNPVLDELLEYNKKQLEERINFLNEIVNILLGGNIEFRMDLHLLSHQLKLKSNIIKNNIKN